MTDFDPTEIYVLEATELLEQIEACLLEVGERPGDPEIINRLFRCFHTIKGSGAMCGFDAVAGFTHHVENALHQVREGTLPMSPALSKLVLEAHDQVKLMVANLADPTLAQGPNCVRIIAALQQLEEGDAPSESPAIAADAASAASPSRYRVRFSPSPQLLESGLNIGDLWEGLRRLGDCVEKPCECEGALEAEITTAHEPNAIRDVFIFVENGGELLVEPCDSAPPPLAGTHSRGEAIPAPEPGAGPRGNTAAPTRAAARDSVVRVASDKLDHLVDLVGELVMNQSRLLEVAGRIHSAELAEPVESMERLVADLRDSVLGIRMMPIGATFNRFKRLVRDLACELGKEIELITEGEETELDKTVLDQLGDPLVHLVRNSMDHGIERPEERLRAGKARMGVIRLTATHEGAHVIVAIQDDGRGLDKARIREKAVERNLIANDASLSDEEIYSLIFLPGFSTAQQVTSVSGRGVGMDVVKRQIESLRGAITVRSQAGRGATISLTLPLTLAIIDGLLVEIGSDRFIIPMTLVSENVELTAAERAANNGRNIVSVRGELISYISLREVFAVEGNSPAIEKIVIVNHAGRRVGLVVDRVIGTHQTVIQPLGHVFQNVEVTSGATIMGDGCVALILDIAGLVAFVETQAAADNAARPAGPASSHKSPLGPALRRPRAHGPASNAA